MAEILGLGLTHYPGLFMKEQDASIFLRNTLAKGGVPKELQDPANWPEQMRREWSDDFGARAAIAHRERGFAAMRKMRNAIDDFEPDLLLIWGDDQYENFIEDIVPPFCVYILDEIESRPYWEQEPKQFRGNIWNDPEDKVFHHRGHPDAARLLVNGMNDRGIDVPYAYRLRYKRGLAHAFINTLMYLDADRRGFDFPVIPFHVNCYGGEVIRRRGGMLDAAEVSGEPDPGSPSARSCFEIGRAVARIFQDSRYRVALIASSSWSHAFLTKKTHYLYPDHESDRKRLSELKSNNFAVWGDLDKETIDSAGHHEFLNWVCLAGAMTEIKRNVEVLDYVETYVLNSNKCYAMFPA
ncbi:MAG: extradiol ring-cleavage dioxygenase [Betaproteobacteria bacterium]|nr:extradiol ring-cleavage dioxygenase [Betaproteobacteria bacterium]